MRRRMLLVVLAGLAGTVIRSHPKLPDTFPPARTAPTFASGPREGRSS
jgi:hypothetical protein